ncbi:hypothetical protein ACULNC_02080 [Shigella flexneri]
MAAEEFTQAMNGVREFNRLQGIDLKSYQFETILSTHRAAVWTVKPRKWCRRIHVFCISPAIRNVMQKSGNISQTHKVERLALFDQFPLHAPYGVRRITDREVKPMPDAPASGIILITQQLPAYGYASSRQSRTP